MRVPRPRSEYTEDPAHAALPALDPHAKADKFYFKVEVMGGAARARGCMGARVSQTVGNIAPEEIVMRALEVLEVKLATMLKFVEKL